MQEFYKELVSILKEKRLSKQDIHKLKIRLSKKYKLKKIPTDIEVFLNSDYEEHSLLMTKPVRTLSGVAVIALMTAPESCKHGRCTFCPGGPGSYFGDVPQSYTGKEPSTMRSIRNNYDPYLIVMNRLEQYICSGHVPDKAEIIIQGGTFPSMDKKYQEEFIKYIFKAMNDFSNLFYKDNKLDFQKFKEFFELPGDLYDKARVNRIKEKLLANKGDCSLEEEQLRNETAKIRCVGLTIETKPDWGFLKHGNEMLRQGCTRIELGVQTTKDEVLRATNRGHSIHDTVKSIQQLRDIGFKLNFHMMPGLPKTNLNEDIEIFKEIFNNPDYRPDMLKVYPCMVMPGTPLFIQYQRGEFTPMTTEQAAEVISEFKRFIPRYCRLNRVQRDIPTFQTTAGVDRTNLRQHVEKKVKEKGIECPCIRCREAGRRGTGTSYKINIMKYEASKGQEFFISADTDIDSLLGFVRLRFPSQFLREEITKDAALIRELHVYGTALAIGKHSEAAVQHKGIGKELMKKAEEIALKYGKNKMVVISAVGTRGYYAKLGYEKDGPYMSKILK